MFAPVTASRSICRLHVGQQAAICIGISRAVCTVHLCGRLATTGITRSKPTTYLCRRIAHQLRLTLMLCHIFPTTVVCQVRCVLTQYLLNHKLRITCVTLGKDGKTLATVMFHVLLDAAPTANEQAAGDCTVLLWEVEFHGDPDNSSGIMSGLTTLFSGRTRVRPSPKHVLRGTDCVTNSRFNTVVQGIEIQSCAWRLRPSSYVCLKAQK